MPYIKKDHREVLNDKIKDLANHIKALASQEGEFKISFAGLLNYTCTKLALSVMPERRYYAVALITGVFKNIADEFYRRLAAPYEDEQIIKNGDVYPTFPKLEKPEDIEKYTVKVRRKKDRFPRSKK